MRILGGVMILGGCLGIGLWYREQWIGRNRALYSLNAILEMFMSEIRYGKTTFPECCRNLSKRMPEPYGSCLYKIWEKTQENRGASFQKIFCDEMQSCLIKLPLQKEDAEFFLQPFSGAGFQDGSMQLRSIGQSMEQIARLIGEGEKDLKEKCRMAVGLGAMSGLLLLIILI